MTPHSMGRPGQRAAEQLAGLSRWSLGARRSPFAVRRSSYPALALALAAAFALGGGGGGVAALVVALVGAVAVVSVAGAVQ